MPRCWLPLLLLPTLLAQAVVAGSATYSLLDVVIDVPDAGAVQVTFLAALGALALLLATELWSHGSRHVELATLEMTRGAYAGQFWFGGVLNGLIVPAVLLTLSLRSGSDGPGPAALAGVAALFGLFTYEDAYVRAGQSVPLS